MLKLKRVYEPYDPADGVRYFVERLWPRGIKKENLLMEDWLKDVAPSQGLRLWYAHEPAKWEAFQRRYRAELDANPAAWQPLLDACKQGPVTLLYSARDTEHNSALVLKAYLEEHLAD